MLPFTESSLKMFSSAICSAKVTMELISDSKLAGSRKEDANFNSQLGQK